MPLEPLPNRQGNSIDRKRDGVQDAGLGNPGLRIPGQSISPPQSTPNVTSPWATPNGISDSGHQLDRLLSGRRNPNAPPVARWAEIASPHDWFAKAKKENALATLPQQDLLAQEPVRPEANPKKVPRTTATGSGQVVRLKV